MVKRRFTIYFRLHLISILFGMSFSLRRAVKFGAPFFVLILGGAYTLSFFSSIRYEYRRQKRITPEEAKEMGLTMKRPEEVTLKTEYEKIKDIDIYNWKNIRGPRPWEKGNESAKKNKENE